LEPQNGTNATVFSWLCAIISFLANIRIILDLFDLMTRVAGSTIVLHIEILPIAISIIGESLFCWRKLELISFAMQVGRIPQGLH
jgi:hypothetical protein